MRTTLWTLAAAVAVTACASGGAATAPDRALFRLPTRGVVAEPPSVAAGVVDEPSGPPVRAYRVALRVQRGDGTSVVAPSVVALPGQRASVQSLQQFAFIQDFDVEVEGGAFLADPVIGMLSSGWTLDVTASDVPGSATSAALAFSLRSCDVRKPIEARTLGLLTPRHDRPVTVQLPRRESVEVTGARRVALGETVEIARMPDAAGGGELVVSARVDVDQVPESLVRPVVRASPREEDAVQRSLAELGAAAASGRASRGVRVVAVRLPDETADPDAPGVERLAALSVVSVLAPGVGTSDRLHEAFVSRWDVVERRLLVDPVIAEHDSGLTAEVADANSLVVRWRTTPSWIRSRWSPGHEPRLGTDPEHPSWSVAVDHPVSTEVERRVPLTPGRSVHPVFRLGDGGVAAVVVDVGEE